MHSAKGCRKGRDVGASRKRYAELTDAFTFAYTNEGLKHCRLTAKVSLDGLELLSEPLVQSKQVRGAEADPLTWGSDPTRPSPLATQRNGTPRVPLVVSGGGRAVSDREDYCWAVLPLPSAVGDAV